MLRLDLPLHEFFDDPTVDGLAARIAASSRRPPAHTASRPSSRRRPPPTLSGVARPAAALVPAAARARGLLLQHLPSACACAARSGRKLCGAPSRRSSPATSRCAPLRDRRRPAGAAHRAAVRLPLPLVDLSALPAERREDEARRVAFEEAERPFDLVRGPLFRAGLRAPRSGGSRAAPHPAPPGLRRLVHGGALPRAGGALRQPPASGQPAAAAGALRGLLGMAAAALAGPLRDRQLAWWKEQLADLRPLDLPTDHPRPAVQRFRGGWRTTVLPAPLTAALERMGRRSGATPFMVLLAGFATPPRPLVGAGRHLRRRAPSPTAPGPRSKGSSGSSSTPWSCVSIWAGSHPSPRCWPACGRPPWAPGSTRTCRSRSSSRSWCRSGT